MDDTIFLRLIQLFIEVSLHMITEWTDDNDMTVNLTKTTTHFPHTFTKQKSSDTESNHCDFWMWSLTYLNQSIILNHKDDHHAHVMK